MVIKGKYAIYVEIKSKGVIKLAADVYYSLGVNSKGEHNSFSFETKKAAEEAYNFISDKFREHKVVLSKDNYSQDIVQLTINETFEGSVPAGVMASFLPQEFFKDVYADMLKSAREYQEAGK